MKAQLLRDAAIIPSNEVIQAALGNSFPVYEVLIMRLASPEIRIDLEWRYYNDGKAWLCKATAKKKTVFWLSIWEGLFKVSFYFTEKTRGGIENLPIDQEIKNRVKNETPMGKLIPLIFEISQIEQLQDLLLIAGYKKELK